MKALSPMISLSPLFFHNPWLVLLSLEYFKMLLLFIGHLNLIYVIIEQLIVPPSALKICPQFYMCWESFQCRTRGPNLESKGLKVPELRKCCFNNEYSKLKISKGSGARKLKNQILSVHFIKCWWKLAYCIISVSATQQ